MSMSEFLGMTLGQYRIETPIDAGGMGQVYRGVHIYLDRPAAIKVMRAHLVLNPRFRERFLQEAKSAASLKHQNIVDIYEFGEQDGQLYLVMELVPDGSLRRLLNRRAKQPWPLAQGLDLMRQAAEGLDAAHRQHVVHRDIKPDNMLLLHQPSTGQYQLKISDFGLARLAEGSGLTATGAPMGTLAYMSPEQCIGGKIDGRSDLYSLGVVIYEVVTGYLPFQIDSFDDALRKHTQAVPTPPSQLLPGIPAALETLILRCLAKKPEDRYQSGADVARDLQSILAGSGLETFDASVVGPASFASSRTNNTALNATNANNTNAPAVVTLQGYADQPRIRVLDSAGETIQVVELGNRSTTLTAGRQSGNAIVLPSDNVSRQHIQIQWDGTHVMVKDLGSSNGTLLDNTRLAPEVSYPWANRQMIHIGSYWLRLEGDGDDADKTRMQPAQPDALPTALQSVAYAQQQAVSNTYTAGGNGRIGIQVEPKNLTITPGQPANVRVLLTNLGNLVDWLTVTVEGVPSEWVSGPDSEVQLNPAMQESVDLGINVAKSPKNLARDYPVTIRARSREKPSESGTAAARWVVKPFKDTALRIDPRRVRGRGNARYAVTLVNNSNIQTSYALNGEDDEQQLAYRFRQEALSLEPGNEARIPLTIEGKRRWIGKDLNQRFQVHSQVNGEARALNGNAEFVNRALIPPWLLSVVAAIVAFSLLLGSLSMILHQQPIQAVMTAAKNPMAVLQAMQQGAPTTQATTTTPPNNVPPMALSPTAAATTAAQPMQAMNPPATTQTTTNAFIQQATTANSSKNFTAINATLTNNNPNAAIFITQNVTPNGGGQVLNNHPEGVWFDQTNWAIFNEDDMPMTQQAAFNVWIPKKTTDNFVQTASSTNISGGGTVIDNALVNNNSAAVLLVTQNWNPAGSGGVFNPHPIGVTFTNGSWVIFNEDGAAIAAGASFNVHVLSASTSDFVQTASGTNMTNGATVIDNASINNDPKAIILVTQLWNVNGSTSGVYNNHPVGVAFNGTNWEIVNEDQTPIPQGAAFNVVIVKQ